MPDARSTHLSAIPATPLSDAAANRLNYAGPGASASWGPRERRRLMLVYFVILAVPLAAVVYFHAGVAWGRRREGTDTLFAPATGTDFYETWFVAVPFYAVTVALAVIASSTTAGVFAKRLTRAWLQVPVGCAAAWVVFCFYLALAADGPFP